MARTAPRYLQIVTYRFVLAVLALLLAAWAGNQIGADGSAWLVTCLFAVSASAALIWPFMVPADNRAMTVYSVGPAFFLAGMFLLPPGGLVLAIGFAIALAGIVHGTRAYRTVFQLSTSILAYGGFALVFRLGPQPSDIMFHPAPRAGLELLIEGAAVVALLLMRSVSLRLEHGERTPHWGAFQRHAIVELTLCLAFATTITVLARIHLALLVIVYVEMVAIWWFLHRYHGFTGRMVALRAVAVASRPAWNRVGRIDRLGRVDRIDRVGRADRDGSRSASGRSAPRRTLPQAREIPRRSSAPGGSS
ncbi:MAG: hypothetical protein ACRENN_09285 [Candidatus Eiseniibacteriota bacterium]